MRLLGFLLGLAAANVSPTQSATPSPISARERLVDYLDTQARRHLTARAGVMAGIATPEQAQKRQAMVRAKLADLIHLENATGPVRSRITHRERGDGYTVDALWYESLPGYRVTADLYRPEGPGPFPAILLQPGHWVDGKLSDHEFAANFARAGFVVLSIDIVGLGERIQFYDPAIGASKVGRPTGEHSMAFAQALPTGGHVSRFFIQDAVSGVDYLLSRADVDGMRIGAFGCSGAGATTAYLAALDLRIKAAAVACWVNDMDHLLGKSGPGAQEAEQSIPFFVEQGLDLPDWIEAIAPRPLAVVSTTEDMFPIAGARAAFAEASRFYATMGAGDRMSMIEGPGRHGNLLPISAPIVAFFTHWLKDEPAVRPFRPETIGDPARLLVFPANTPGTAPGSRSLADLIGAEAPRPAPIGRESAADRQARLRSAIQNIARTEVVPGASPPEVLLGQGQVKNGYVVSPLRFDAAPGLEVDGLYARSTLTGPRPTLLVLSPTPLGTAGSAGGVLDIWAHAGWNVLALEPRGAGGSEDQKSPLTGDWTLLSLRALLVGKTPVGMRADDAVAALNWLASRSEVDRGRLVVQGDGALGPVALHVGVLDSRITHVIAQNSITSYREIAERPISRDAAEVNLPGVLARYDLPDLMAELGPRLTFINPINSVGEPLKRADWAKVVPASVRVVMQTIHDPIAPFRAFPDKN
jgi:cephalosporin-C deacetylase-like acetyl esterase